jgi:hypothetical protein
MAVSALECYGCNYIRAYLPTENSLRLPNPLTAWTATKDVVDGGREAEVAWYAQQGLGALRHAAWRSSVILSQHPGPTSTSQHFALLL